MGRPAKSELTGSTRVALLCPRALLLYCHGCCPLPEDTASNLEAACPNAPESAIELAVALGEGYRNGNQISPCACREMTEAGFNSVYRLAGNYASWVQAGYPVAIGAGSGRSFGGQPLED